MTCTCDDEFTPGAELDFCEQHRTAWLHFPDGDTRMVEDITLERARELRQSGRRVGAPINQRRYEPWA